MDLFPYIDGLRQELAVAAAVGGENAQALADRLTAPLESAMRLALMEALSAAAGEITRELAPGSVDVRLRGRDPSFVVTRPPNTHEHDEDQNSDPEEFHAGARQPSASGTSEADDGGTSRLTLRLPDHLKPRIDAAAGRDGISVNAWLVRAATAALEPSRSPGTDRTGRREPGRRYTGWVR